MGRVGGKRQAKSIMVFSEVAYCCPGSIPRLGVICRLSFLVLYSAPRGFSPGTPVFPSPQNQC